MAAQKGSEDGKSPAPGTEATVPGPKKNPGAKGEQRDNKLRTAEEAMSKEVLLGNE